MQNSINDASVGWRSATGLRIAPLLVATAALVACNSRSDTEPAKKTLPTRQTTIDPVTKKLDTAREDAERRRQQADEAYK